MLADANQAFDAGNAVGVRYHRSNSTEASDSIQRWEPERRWQTGQVSRASWDYRTLGLRPAGGGAAATVPAVPATDADTADAQTAIVTGNGDPIHSDRDHRVIVQQHWQRGSNAASRLDHPRSADAPADATSGTWARLLTPMAGGVGIYAVQRVERGFGRMVVWRRESARWDRRHPRGRRRDLGWCGRIP